MAEIGTYQVNCPVEECGAGFTLAVRAAEPESSTNDTVVVRLEIDKTPLSNHMRAAHPEVTDG